MINQLVGDPSHSFGMTIQNINRVFPVPRSIRPIRFARSPRDESIRPADKIDIARFEWRSDTIATIPIPMLKT